MSRAKKTMEIREKKETKTNENRTKDHTSLITKELMNKYEKKLGVKFCLVLLCANVAQLECHLVVTKIVNFWSQL